ncbi:unnamed protein product [Adineta ricciae]|uniref:Poly [ADP-ribose] polymerase n=1 Tax=Adineta ricciae TaxID=249248 RepID=A0A813N6N5_ADIRI|nr:unnamed protein product [Adineta ricciae]CAF0851171.1 unnamed protein product [Adineta ricciae]
MADRMDITMDFPSFDLQLTQLSHEERRWLWTQKEQYKLDKIVHNVADLYKHIQSCSLVSYIQKLLTPKTMIAKPALDDKFHLYYSSTMNGNNNQEIDQFRLYHQQLFRLTFADIVSNVDYLMFVIFLEGTLFYSTQTAKEYSAAFTTEMRKCLSSFDTYIQTRATKLLNVISLASESQLSIYTPIHLSQQNHSEILFQLYPKVKYYVQQSMPFNSILATDGYVTHRISPEELRYIDYSLNMKHQRYVVDGFLGTQAAGPLTIYPTSRPTTVRSIPTRPSVTHSILHSLPIIYPYSDDMVYAQTYPTFWQGDHHLKEHNDALFYSSPVDKSTAEYLFVQRLFHQTLCDKKTNIIVIERIQNPHLWEKFCSHRRYMRQKNGSDQVNEAWLFHGTKSDNHHHIISHGFNRSYCRETVYYGRGVYFSRFAAYSHLYGDQKDLSHLFLCRVLVGYHTYGANDIHVPPEITTNNGKKVKADSTTDHQTPYGIVCTFLDDQNYPEYVITYVNK